MPEPNAPLSRNDAISLHAGLARSIVKDIAHSFAAQDIVLLPIKGVLLQQWVYDSPAKRPTTDIDLLIRRDDQHNAHRLLLDQGYRFVETCRSRVARVYQSPWGLSIDLHHRIFPYGRFAMPTEGIIQRSTYDTQLFDAPIRRMHALDLFAHMLGKLTGDHADLNDARRLQDMREIPQAQVERGRCGGRHDRPRSPTRCRGRRRDRRRSRALGSRDHGGGSGRPHFQVVASSVDGRWKARIWASSSDLTPPSARTLSTP